MKKREVSLTTRRLIHDALFRPVFYSCDNCGTICITKKSAYERKRRHFCCQDCYSAFRKNSLPKEEQHAFGHGHSPEERRIRRKCRSILNHAIRDGKIKRGDCVVCGEKAEAHHDDYSKPLDVKWLCFKHHKIYENPGLLEDK